MFTREDVAKYANVSVGTVSNVLNNKGHVKKELEERVKNAIRELNYHPNYSARSLASNRSRHIGIAIYETTNPYHLEIVRGIEDYALQKGYIVSIFMLDNDFESKLKMICERRVDAIINFMTNDYPHEFIDILKQQKTVMVNFNEELGPVYDFNYKSAMLQLMEKMQKYGHRKVGFIFSGDRPRFEADSRGRAFSQNRGAFGFATEESLIYYNNEANQLSEEIGYYGAKALFGRDPGITAFFAANDLAAIGAIRALYEMGKSVPHDVSVVGCDDIGLAKKMVPALTTIGFDKYGTGREICAEVIAQIECLRGHKIVIEPSAVFRESLYYCP